MNTPTTIEPNRPAPIRSKDWLSDPKWIKSIKAKAPKLRAGAKLLWNKNTGKIAPIFTIEIWHHPQRRYLPLAMPDGNWRWEKSSERDDILNRLNAILG